MISSIELEPFIGTIYQRFTAFSLIFSSWLALFVSGSPLVASGREAPRRHPASVGCLRGAGPSPAVVPADAQRTQRGGQRQRAGHDL